MALLPSALPLPNSAELKRIQLRSRRLVTGDLLGQYRSAFRGTGLVYTDIRAYQPGDDVKHIHWKATARTGTVFIKSFEEDRQLRVLLAVDTSASMRAPQATEAFAKALEFSSLVTALTQRGNDQIGLLLFGASVESYLQPKSGRKRHNQILSQLLQDRPGSPATDLAGGMRHISTMLRKPSIVFVISDFLGAPFKQDLKTVCAMHDVVLVQVQTPLESLAPLGLVMFADAESGAKMVVDTGNPGVRERWHALLAEQRQAISDTARECGADHIVIHDSATRPLVRLMRERATRGVRR
jgi:uncharacterized protein (DUF58 family)